MSDEQEKVYSLNSKFLSFGLAAIALIVVVICGGLIIGLYSMSTRYIDQLELAAERQKVIHSLTRALDRAEGKLLVYESYITDRREDSAKKLIVSYLRKTKSRSNQVTLADFEKWMDGGIGVGGR
jgi:hypothetical protein